MNSTGFDATAAKLAALEQRIALTSNNKQEDVPETLSREQVVNTVSSPSSFAAAAKNALGLTITLNGYVDSHQVMHEVQSYQGYQYDASKGFGSDAVIYEDKNTRFNESSDPYNPKYYEVGAAWDPNLSKEENQALVAKIMENKLDPTGNYEYFKEGESNGSMKLDYGVSPFDWKTMRGLTDQVYAPDDPARPRFIEHNFSANGSITTQSGKEVKFNMQYNEQLSNGMGIIVKGAQESAEDFDKRVIKEVNDLNKSQSDYRTISFNFESSSALTKDESGAMNLLAQRLMETAEKASQGGMTKKGFDLNSQFSGLESLFESVELNAKYTGAGQNETKMEIEILNQSIESRLELERNQESDYNMERFWDY